MNLQLAFLPNLGMTELLVLAFLGLLIFGKKLPEVGKSLGQGLVSFKKGLQGVETDLNSAMEESEKPRKKKRKKKALDGDAASLESAELPASSEEESPATEDHATKNHSTVH